VHHDYCRPRVLTIDLRGGRASTRCSRTADEDERRRYGEIIYRFVFGSLHRFRLFNADPHPGNYLFPGDGTVVLPGLRQRQAVPEPATRDAIQRQLRAVIADDTDRR
jgi:predicted unusual protein kinase regulating ubiquinone biosynthesis (AarF/ABC1/UbiB family)